MASGLPSLATPTPASATIPSAAHVPAGKSSHRIQWSPLQHRREPERPCRPPRSIQPATCTTNPNPPPPCRVKILPSITPPLAFPVSSQALRRGAPQPWQRRFWSPIRKFPISSAVAGEASPSGHRTVEVNEATQQSEKDRDQFSWDQAWYPVGILDDFDPKVPAAVTVYGTPLVVWYERNLKEWRVFHDLCPHRLAPLSEGRIHESGHIQCSYHGWTFRGDGGCSGIPQADPDRPQAHRSPRACARVYPSRVHQGILWFWPQPLSPQSQRVALATPPGTVPALEDPNFQYTIFQMDVGYGQEILMENLLDPAHVPFAHHNIQNQGKREDGMPLDFFVQRISRGGIVASGLPYSRVEFQAPCLITISTNPDRFKEAREKHKRHRKPPQQQQPGIQEDQEPGADTVPPRLAAERAQAQDAAPGGRKFGTAMWCIPQAPGRSRLIVLFGGNFLPPSFRRVPRWLLHLTQMLILDSDMYLLHLMEKRLRDDARDGNVLAAYHTPTRSDGLVNAYRRWLLTRAGGGIQWPAAVDPQLPLEVPKRQLMDRHQNHVKICQSCQKALRWLEAIQVSLKALAFVCLCALVLQGAFTGQKPPSLVGAGLLLFAGFASAALSFLLSKFISKNYYFHDYIHALVP